MKSVKSDNESGNTTDHSHGHHGWGHDSDAESTFSGVSWSDEDDSEYTGLSDSEGTSQETGEASTLTSVSFVVKEYKDIYENANADEELTLLDADVMRSYLEDSDASAYDSHEHDHDEFNGITGVEWIGDADNEIIFGTSWLDGMFGEEGDDKIMGLEGADYISGGPGVDMLYGGAGNDQIWTGWSPGELDTNDAVQQGTEPTGTNDFASGGSGDDKIYGNSANTAVADANSPDPAAEGFAEALFGGAGNDELFGYGGDDTLRGGTGHDRIEGGYGDDDIEGNEGDDDVSADEGDDTVRGGDGQDILKGNDGNDDLYGDDGDDDLYGGDGNDDIWGGKGDDVIIGGLGVDVLRGEDGDDSITAGTSATAADAAAATIHVYGGAGDDAIWGQNATVDEFLLGGSGDDYILSGPMGADSEIWGNDGDDNIRVQMKTASATIHAGKGDDTVNELTFVDGATPKFQALFQRVPAVDSYGFEATPIEVIYGNQGDDEIWGSAKTVTSQHLHGGSGDDSVYAGYQNAGKVYVYGNSGEDVVRGDWFQQFDSTKTNTETEQWLFGDYKYGEDALDKDLWGDDDLIYGGDGSDASKKAWRYGGDGADSIWTGGNWLENKSLGGNGDDKFYLGGLNAKLFTYGEDDDDEWFVESYGSVGKNFTGFEYGFGGAGNDVVRGTHQPTGKQYLYGGDDEDKLYGGDKVGAENRLVGGDGDDWIEGGDKAVALQTIYGDSSFKDVAATFENVHYGEQNDFYKVEDRGNDVIYGGDFAAAGQNLVGGYGDDKIIGGNKEVSVGQKVYGDHFYFSPNNGGTLANFDGITGNDLKFLGLPNDGDDLIDMGDHPDHTTGALGNYAYGQGGNDKIIGGITS